MSTTPAPLGEASHSPPQDYGVRSITGAGSSLYRYDQSNRMISTTLSGATTLFNYNSDGVRLKQVSVGVPTTYTQDIAAPLPVVLQAKTGTVATQYLFSMGTRPIAQYTSSAFQYLLADGLGSVRQIADASGHVILAESYQPYGTLLNSSGSAISIFAYAGGAGGHERVNLPARPLSESDVGHLHLARSVERGCDAASIHERFWVRGGGSGESN